MTAPSQGHTAGQWTQEGFPPGSPLQCSQSTACQTELGLNKDTLEAHMVIDGRIRYKQIQELDAVWVTHAIW